MSIQDEFSTVEVNTNRYHRDRDKDTEHTRLTKENSQPPPSFPCPSLSLFNFLLLPWYINDREKPTCPSRCCRKCDFCCFHRCCGNKYIRHILIILLAIIVFYVFWCIGVGISFSKISPQLSIQSLEIKNSCSYDIEVLTKLQIHSDSWIKAEIRDISSLMYFSKNNDEQAFASLTFSSDEQTDLYSKGVLQSESIGIRSGTQSLDMLVHMRALSLTNTALFAAKVLNNTRVKVYVKTTASIHTSVLWFPITISHDLMNEFTFNEPEVGPPPTPMKILAVEIESRETILIPKNKSVAIFTWSTLFLNRSSIALYAPLPHLFLDVYHENIFIATTHISPLYVFPIFNLSLDIALDLNLSSVQSESIQRAISYYNTGQNMSIQIRGSGSDGRLLPQVSSFPPPPFFLNYSTVSTTKHIPPLSQQAGEQKCFIQALLDAMPLVSVSVPAKIPCPLPTKGSPPANFTYNFTANNPVGCLPTEWQGEEIVVSGKNSNRNSNSSNSSDSVFVPTLLETQQIVRNDTNMFEMQAYIEANISLDFSLYGYFDPLFFNLFFDKKENFGYVKIDSFFLSPQQTQYKGNLLFQTINESSLIKKLLNYKDINSLGLSLKGKPDENKLSELLMGFETNITSAKKNTSSVSSPTAAYLSFEENPVNFSVGFDLNAQILPPFLNISLPQISITIVDNNNNNSSGNTSNSKVLEINAEQTRLLSYHEEIYVIKNVFHMLCDLSMSDNMGIFVNSFFDDRQQNMSKNVSIKGVSTDTHFISKKPLVIDFQLHFSLDQIENITEAGEKEEDDSSSSSDFGVGIEITKLFRNDSLMTLQWLTNLSWKFPVELTGTFPEINVNMNLDPPYNGTSVSTTIASINTNSFLLQGNLASTFLDINVVNQGMLIRMLLKPDAFNLTVMGTSTSNVLSRIVSHLGVTFNVKNKGGELSDTTKEALKQIQPPSSLYEININSSSLFLQTSVYLNLSSASFPINLSVPAVYLSLLSYSSSSFIEMSTLNFDGAFFSSSSSGSNNNIFSSSSSFPSQKQRLGYLNTLASRAPYLGTFLSDLLNKKDVGFALKSNASSLLSSASSSSTVDVNFQLDSFNLAEILDLISSPSSDDWTSLPQLTCSDIARFQPGWNWNKPGDDWVVSCPAACMESVNEVSEGVYSYNSSVCTAARLEGTLSSCGGKVLVVIGLSNTFSIETYVSHTLWPLKSLEPLSVARNESTLLASAGVVLASLGVPLTGSLPELGFTIASNSSQVLMRAQVADFTIPPMNSDLSLVMSTTVLEQQALLDVISNAKEQGANLTIAGQPGPHVIHMIANAITYALNVPPVNLSALSLFPSVWPVVTVDVDSNSSSATVSVSTRFTPEFNAGFDFFVGALRSDVWIGQLKGYPDDGYTMSGSFQSDAFTLKDNACSNLTASFVLTVPSANPAFLTNAMRQFFHGYAFNASFQGTLNASDTFGTRSLSVNMSVPAPVSPNPPAETDSRCLCEPVWQDQGQFFYGECAKTLSHPNGWCMIQNNSCIGGNPLSSTYDSCTQQVTRTYYGCECMNTWSYNTTQYTDGGCHNPDNSLQPWCLVKPGSCFGDSFTSAYIAFPNSYLSSAAGVLYRCGSFYSQANTEAECDADPLCVGYNLSPTMPLVWCLASVHSDGLLPLTGISYHQKSIARATYRVRDVCGNPSLYEARNAIVLNSLNLLGSGIDNRVVIPCLLPGTFCPYESDGLNATSIEVLLNLSLAPLPFPLHVNLRTNLDIVFQGYGISSLVSVKVRAMNFSSTESVSVVVLITPLNLPLLQRAVTEITHGKNNVDISVAGQTGAGVGLLSAMFARIGVKFTFFKLAVDANGYILDSEKNYNFSYWLAATTSDSATVAVATPLKNPVNITWNLGQVDIKAWYALQGGEKNTSVVVATSSFPFVLYPGVNNMYVNATLVSEPTLNACAGYPQPVSPPTFCAANEIVSRVLSKTSFNGVPLRLEITTTNFLNQKIIIEVDLSLLSFDTTQTRGKVLKPDNLYIIDSYQFNILSSVWSSLSSASVTLDMSITLYNPFNITMTATSLALSVYMKDWEGGKIDNSAIAAILGKQTVPPADNMFLLSHIYNNPAGITIGYQGKQEVDVKDIQVSGLTSDLAVHLYDNYEEKDRACVHVTNGMLQFSVQGSSSPLPLTVTQFFSRRDISAAGWAACQGPQNCTNTQTISTWNLSTWTTVLKVNPGTASAGVDGSGLRLTSGSQQYSSAFINQKVLFADSWETSFDIYWDYGGFTATGIGEGISMIFHDRPAGAGLVTNGYYGYLDPANTRSVAIVFAADHVRGCLVNCGEDMKIVRNGVEVPTAPTDQDPKRSQFVWGSAYWSTVTIKYNYDTKFMYIYVGSQLYLVWTVDFVISNFADVNGMGFVGFSARTANYYQGTFRVNNWQWKRYKVQQENIRIEGSSDGSSSSGDNSSLLNIGFAGPQALNFFLDTRDSCNFAVYSDMISSNSSGSSSSNNNTFPPVLVLLSGHSGGSSEGKNVNASSVISVSGFPGLLKVFVFMNVAGVYDVHVKCNSVACIGSDSFSFIGIVEISPAY